MIKFIYFDFGGVLVNYDNVFQKVCADFYLDFNEFLKFYNKFEDEIQIGEDKTEYFWKECIKKFNLKNAESYDLAKFWVSDYKIIKPISDLIYSLENKINIGIMSNINNGIWQAAFKYKYVPHIKYKKVLLSYKTGIIKPNDKIYKMAQQESGVKPDEILFIDDKEENLKIPKNIGWKTVLFDMNQAEKGIEEIKAFLK